MKGWSEGVLLGLMVLQSAVLHVRCVEPVHCQWGHYGDWSECDGCSKTQSRTRHIVTYAQFGGAECTGQRMQTQSCTPTSGCPLEEGCGERFRCSSGQCISRALVCNGDQDCEEDALDEQGCRGSLCDIHKVPANTELTGKGMDVITGESRGTVINTKAFGGQCRRVFSGDSRHFYRLPQSLVGFTFQVKIENDFSNEFYDSSWSYVKHEEQRKNSNEGYHYKTFHKELSKKETHRLMIIKNEVEVGQFQNAPAAYLPLSEEFWKGLSGLPTVYDYAAYRGLIKRYGTHFLSEGTLGGKYQVMLGVEAKSESEKRTSSSRTPVYPSIYGGDPAYIAGLSVIDLQDPAANMNMYSKWAGSVKNFPTIIKPKLRPLHELVKEVPCAAVKRLHLKRAIEEYQTEEHPCRCKPCQNNGLPVLSGTTCSCVCKKETYGPACEYGTVMDEQPGVIHGDWTCWSDWSSCSQGQRSRTRSCSNPYPSGGGKHCNGESEERKSCEDEDLQHLRLMEPHCFDSSLSTPRHCQTPPPLVNGIILVPKDMYLVGSRVTYACVQGFHLVGVDTAECMEDLSWKRSRMECKSVFLGHQIPPSGAPSTVCMVPPLPRDVTGSPWNLTYQIGEMIALSCPRGKVLEGVSEIHCDSSLNWSPHPESIKCNLLPTISPLKSVGCKQWEKEEKGRCVCKLPYECSLSLDVCARSEEKGRSLRLSLCKMQALICLGQRYVLTNNSACQWPSRDTAACSICQPGETCDGGTGRCRCKEPTECTDPGAQLCVQYSESAATITMSECEIGLRRCKGESLSVTGITACQE